MIQLENVTKVFDTDLLKKKFTALDDVSFEIKAGKIVGYLGANGAGKTTSIKIMMDFIRPSSGRVIYGKELGGSIQGALTQLGYLPERPYYYPHLTGREFVQYLAALSNVSGSDCQERINYWGPQFKIDFALDRYLKNYSKGMLQRIGMLASLIHRPRLIILDEPLSGLDPVGRKEIKDIIKKINKEEGITVFFSSHIVSDVEEICHDTIFIKDGQLVYQGAVDQLLRENSEKRVTISYYQKGQLQYKEVQEDVNAQLRCLIEQGAEIFEVNANRPSLEEIIYKI